MSLIYSLLGVLVVSLISFVGVLFLALKKSVLEKTILFLVSFAVGGLMGDVFIHLLPEAVEKNGFTINLSLYILIGVLLFFILEKFIHWRHCHVPTSRDHPHPLAAINLVSDLLHNLLDGVLIAGSFIISPALGFPTLLAVILHEIPQEIGDFSVLIYSGISRRKAVFYNFLSSLSSFIGVFLMFMLKDIMPSFLEIVIPVTAGGFIYIAGSDLIPELHKETDIKKSLLQFLGLLLGLLVMLLLKII